ncbi:hypothetical protein GCM10020370_71590 [Paenibacillus hodogayensis]
MGAFPRDSAELLLIRKSHVGRRSLPNPANRVRLTDEKDEYGVPRAKVTFLGIVGGGSLGKTCAHSSKCEHE